MAHKPVPSVGICSCNYPWIDDSCFTQKIYTKEIKLPIEISMFFNYNKSSTAQIQKVVI